MIVKPQNISGKLHIKCNQSKLNPHTLNDTIRTRNSAQFEAIHVIKLLTAKIEAIALQLLNIQLTLKPYMIDMLILLTHC